MPYELQFAALGHPLRQQILTSLGEHGASVRELTDALPASQPVISQHLKTLREAGLVSAQAEGAKRIYRAEPEALADLKAYLEARWAAMLGGLADD